MAQEIIVYSIVGLTILFSIIRIFRKKKTKPDDCSGGCSGCSISNCGYYKNDEDIRK